MQFLKKNQVIIFVIALMFIAAGYLSFTSNNNAIPTAKLANAEEMAEIGDATLVNANAVIEDENTAETIIENENSVIGTSVQITQDEYFSQSRLDRDTMYSQTLDTYQKIIENESISADQKAIAQKEISKINEQKNSIMIAENLIKVKGFEDLIIFINGENVSVIVKSDKLEEKEIAQIQNIVTRELGVKIENINISNK